MRGRKDNEFSLFYNKILLIFSMFHCVPFNISFIFYREIALQPISYAGKMLVEKMLAAKMFTMKFPRTKIPIRNEESQASQTYSVDSISTRSHGINM